MRDLGYFDLGDLQAIHDKKAYYISRLKLNTRIYIKNPEPEYFKNGTWNDATARRKKRGMDFTIPFFTRR
ncbi:hypothetical protein HNP81_003650 [Peribacillus huizhouensis]|uniref:Transposase IS4-like domain-containing protein n=1 Tax=Peribacillus huizhouensis TaxID=1501239 RepID=A0ABR6CTJ8_9BACI|nr:hypothetical protein [Peribacillus huizhouensis]